MTEFDATTIHEASHATLTLLDEDMLGTPEIISARPGEGSTGFIMLRKNEPTPESPELLRAKGRVLVAGYVGEQLAGFEPTFDGDDMSKLAEMAARTPNARRFIAESLAGAEWMLRTYWSAVEGIAELMRMCGGELTAPHGIDLARMKLKEPQQQLGMNRAMNRLLGAIASVPELADPIRAELGLDTWGKRSPMQRSYTRPTTAYLKPFQSIEVSNGRRLPWHPPQRRRAGIAESN